MIRHSYIFMIVSHPLIIIFRLKTAGYTLWKIANGLNVPYTRLMDGIEQETAVVRKSEPAVQTGEPEHYRVFCSFGSTPVRNFELFYAELDAHSSNASIGHSEKAQEYIYMIQGELSFRQKPETISLQRGMPSPLIPPSDILISIRRMP